MNIKNIYDQVKAGGFTNPIGNSLNDALVKLTPPSLSELTALAAAQVTGGASMPTEEQLSGAIASMETALLNTQNMLAHSNVLSGVDLTSGINITSIVRLGNAAKLIEQIDGCELSTSVMGTILNATDIINATVDAVANTEQFLQNIPAYIDSIPLQLEEYSTKLTEQVASDVEALAVAKTVVVNNSIASALVELTENECFSGIFASVMTQPLKDEVTLVTDNIKATKFKSVGG